MNCSKSELTGVRVREEASEGRVPVQRPFLGVFPGRYRNAVVDAETAFEIFLAGLLRIRLAEAGRSDAYIDAALQDNSGRWKDVITIAKDVLSSELDVDFVSTVEYRDWKQTSSMFATPSFTVRPFRQLVSLRRRQ